MNINFFILAGGLGIRAKPLSLFRPKPAFPLNGIPLINLILKQLEKNKLTKGYINFHHLPETLKNIITTNIDIKYIFEKKLSGSGVLSKIQYNDEEYTLIINGDVFLEIPVKGLLKKINETNADGILLIRNDMENYYNKLITKKVKFTGVSAENMLDKMYTGIAVFNSKILKYFKEESFFTSLKKNNFDIRVMEYEGLWLDLGTPKLYYDAVFKHLEYSGLNNTNSLSDGAIISENSTVNGSILWNNVNIHGNSNISNSIVLDNVSINNLKIINKIVFKTNEKLKFIDI